MNQPNPFLPVGTTERDIERQYGGPSDAEMRQAMQDMAYDPEPLERLAALAPYDCARLALAMIWEPAWGPEPDTSCSYRDLLATVTDFAARGES